MSKNSLVKAIIELNSLIIKKGFKSLFEDELRDARKVLNSSPSEEELMDLLKGIISSIFEHKLEMWIFTNPLTDSEPQAEKVCYRIIQVADEYGM